MSRICPSCGNDAGFDVARCPSCGGAMTTPASLDTAAQPPAANSSPTPGGGEWGKTVVEPGTPRPDAGRRPRFDRGPEFYEPIGAAHTGTPDAAGSVDLDRLGHTVVEKSHPPLGDDATVILSSTRRGVTGPLAYLVERSGVRAGKIHLLKGETTIGRSADNVVTLGDESVSKHHARIRVEDGKYVFVDLASTNYSRSVEADGTRPRILEPRELADGDTLDLGEARVTFLLVAEGEPEDAS